METLMLLAKRFATPWSGKFITKFWSIGIAVGPWPVPRLVFGVGTPTGDPAGTGDKFKLIFFGSGVAKSSSSPAAACAAADGCAGTARAYLAMVAFRSCGERLSKNFLNC